MSKQEKHLYEFGPFRLIPSERLLLRAGEPIQLTPKAFDTLLVLVRRGGRLVEKDDFLTEVWAGTSVEESNIAQNVLALRRALSDAEGGGKYIETVPKRGYRFTANVRVVQEGPDEVLVQNRVQAITGATPQDEDLSPQSSGDNPARLKRFPRAALFLVPLAAVLGVASLLYVWSRPARHSSFQTMKITRMTTTGKVFDAAISPDGKHVVYALNEGLKQSLWVRQTATQSQMQIAAPAEVVYTGLNFSPDGNYIYYGVFERDFRQRALFQVETFGGAPTKLLENLSAEPISFSRDGRQFSFIRFTPGVESSLMIANADGTGERELVTLKRPQRIHFPAWSPDGRTIAFVADNNESNDAEILEAQVADGSTRPLSTRKWFRVIGLSWLADGSGLMMLAPPDQSFAAQIWQLPYPEGEAQRLTNDLNNYTHMSLTADSKTLAVVQSETLSNLWVAPVGDTDHARPVTSGSGKSDNCVCWAPDGRIVYQSNAGGTDNIWITGTDGSAPKQLTSNVRINQCPAVSPDGRYIVFHSDRTGVPHVWRMNLDGGEPRQLTDGPSGEQNPQFSPDGRWLVYRTALGGKPTVWKMPAGGGDSVQLTDTLSVAPTISPDGQLIAYLSVAENSTTITVASLAGTDPPKTFAIRGAGARPLHWTPDGRGIAYIETTDGVSNILAQPLDGGKPVPLTSFKEGHLFSFAFSPDGKQVALARGAINRDVVLIKDFR